MRSCGSCTLCCKLLGVTELEKPVGRWCKHCDKGRGCSIYQERPRTCADFECGYLLSDLEEEYRPDKMHFLVTGESAELGAMVVHVDPNYYPQCVETPAAKALLTAMANQKSILLVIGEKRKLMTNDPDAARLVMDKMRELEGK